MAFPASRIQTLTENVLQARMARAIMHNPAHWAALDRAVEAAQAELDAAWADHHEQVLREADGLLGQVSSRDVLGLFPVALEAKLDPVQRKLRLRVWPDAIGQHRHDAALADYELEAGRRYWASMAAAADEEQRKAAFRTIARELDVQRAAWVVRALTPTNRDALSPSVPPLFPDVAIEDPAQPFLQTAALLPQRWIALGYRTERCVLASVGQPIVRPLVTGLDTTPAEAEGLDNSEGRPVRLPRSMRWMTDFTAAVNAGMAMDIPLPLDVTHIDQLYVFGVREGSSEDGASELERLLEAHRFSEGLAFVPQETPTNNTSQGGTGLPGPDEEIELAYRTEIGARILPESMRSNASQTARALGIEPGTFERVGHGGAVVRVYMEPHGFEPHLQHAMQTLLWMPTLGHYCEDLLGWPRERLNALRTHFIEHVRPLGVLPALRVGNQPYGVLPITPLHGFAAEPGEAVDPNIKALLGILMHGGALPDLTAALDVKQALAFDARPYSYLQALRSLTRDGDDWDWVARWIEEQTGGAIPAGWQGRLAQLTGELTTASGEPPPVAAALPPEALVDEGTAAALLRFADSTPVALLAADRHGAKLTRLARYATLLEWTQWARAVCEAHLDATLRQQAEAAAATRRQAWLEIVLAAFGQLPVGMAPPLVLDAQTRSRITTAVNDVNAPPRSSVGGARLYWFRAALRYLAQTPADKLEALAYGSLSASFGRPEMWFTSLASARLATLRKARPRGLVVGGFGFLHDVQAADVLPAFTAEFILAPSEDQAAAAAVLRSAALRADHAASRHADIDLSSRRVRLVQWLIAGVESGRPLKELLGARFERTLRELGAEAAIGPLREAFPSKLPSGVVDGVALCTRTDLPAEGPGAFERALAELRAALDALADALTAESVYQVVRGNPAGGLVDIDDVVRGETPPQLTVTETPVRGTRITHRIVALVPASSTAAGWPAVTTPRVQADPQLNAWCAHLLGPASATVITLQGKTHGDTVRVAIGLDQLGVGALDVVVAGSAGGQELSDRLFARARALHPALTDLTVLQGAEHPQYRDLLVLCSQLMRLLAQAQPLGTAALAAPGVESSHDEAALATRAEAARQRLQALAAALSRPDAGAAAVREAADFGICVAGALLAGEPSADVRETLRLGVLDRLLAAAQETDARSRLRTLVGECVLGLTHVVAPDASVLATAASDPAQTFGMPVARCAAWLATVGRVQPGAQHLSDVLATSELTGRTTQPALRIAQWPWNASDPWIATGFRNEATREAASGRLSILLHAPLGFDASSAMAGFVLATWTEMVPEPLRDTALAIHHNGPNSRAPQALLLAVAPDLGRTTWSVETIRETLTDLVRATYFRQGFWAMFAPAVSYMGHRTDGDAVSFDL
jgi:hypothetical protein